MEFLELVKSRYSVRSYQPRPVEQDKLDRILEAVRLAPSGSNRQPWKFVVVRDAEVRRQLPELPKENVVAEPVGRDTCAAVALGAASTDRDCEGWLSERSAHPHPRDS